MPLRLLTAPPSLCDRFCAALLAASLPLVSWGQAQTQPVPRAFFGAPLELPGVVLHGGGQDPQGFSNYVKVFGTHRPIIYKMYYNLEDDLEKVFARRVAQLEAHAKEFNEFLIPEIGLSMVREPERRAFDDEVAQGRYDQKLEQFCAALRRMGRPAFVRIGFECNGPWNNYRPESYKHAFVRITEMLRRETTETATVWCIVPHRGYMAFYPGDQYVDWWGVDLFSKEDLTSEVTLAFMAEAERHRKPVMFPETTPRYVGVLKSEASWRAWFEPFFDLIHSQRVVKAFCYINWNWADYPRWKNWGDARLEANAVVAERYRAEMSLPLYQHGLSEQALRQALRRNPAP